MATGNKAVHQELLEHRDAAYVLALRIVGKAEDAEDAVQEAYLRAVRYKGAIPAVSEQRRWFLEVVANAAKNQRRSEWSRRNREERFAMSAHSEATSPGRDETLRYELREAVAAALARLDENHRLAISLHYEQGFAYAEAAKLVGVPEGTLRSHASLGMQVLRERLAHGAYAATPAAIVGALSDLGIHASPSLTASLKSIVATGSLPVSAAGGGATAATGAVLGISVKVALASGFILAVVAAVMTARHFAGGANETRGEADNPPAPIVAPAEDPAPKIDKSFTEILEKKVDVVYRREYLSEVLEDLHRRSGLRGGYPISIGTTMVNLEMKDSSLREVLGKVAAISELGLEFSGDTAIFWKRTDDQTLTSLEKNLHDGSAQTRCDSVCEMGSLADKRVLPLLLSALNDKEPSVKMWAVFSLCNFRNTLVHVIPPKDLAEVLLKDLPTAGEYRAAAIRLLGATRDRRAEKFLIEGIAGRDTPVREAAAEALGNYESESAREALLKAIGDDNESVRRNVALAFTATRSELAMKAFFALLDRESFFIDEARTIGSFPYESLEPELEKILSGHNEIATGNVALVLALVRGSGQANAYKSLLPLLRHPSKKARQQAAWALADAAYPDAADVLIKFIDEEPDVKLKQLAFWSLAHLRTTVSTQWVFEHFGRINKSKWSYALTALGETRDSRAEDLLIPMLDSVEPHFAVQGLSAIRSARALDAVIRAVRSDNGFARWDAAISLSHLLHSSAIEPLIGFLRQAPRTRMSSISAICLRPYLIQSPLKDREKIKAALEEYNSRLDFSKRPVPEAEDF